MVRLHGFEFQLFGLVCLLCGVRAHPAACLPENRVTREGYDECLFEIGFLGDFYTVFADPDWDIQLYMDITFNTPSITLSNLCCHDITYEATAQWVNPLQETPYPNYLLRVPPSFHFEPKPDAVVSASDMYAIVMVDQTGYRLDHLIGYAERPPIQWMITNVKNFDTSKVMTLKEYTPPLFDEVYVFLMYLMPGNKEVHAVDWDKYTGIGDGCPHGYENVCIFNLKQMAKDFNWTLVSMSWIRPRISPYTTYLQIHEFGHTEEQVCPLTFAEINVFDAEGRAVCHTGSSGATRPIILPTIIVASLQIMVALSMKY